MRRPTTVALFLAFAAMSVGQTRENPFGPQQTVKLAPTRTFDLLDLDVTLDTNWADRSFRGTAINTLAPLRSGLRELRLMAGEELTISGVTLDGKTAKFRRDGRSLYVTVPPTVKGRVHKVAISYASKAAKGGGFGSEGGFHWIEPNGDPGRQGFWTQGETEYNSNWAPTWDYPNDMTTSTTRVTVPKTWNVIGNGVKKGDVVKGERRTVTWRMDQPHVTYLLASYAFPMDVKTARWRGKQLLYAVPKGLGGLIDDSFSDTPDMLDFFSNTFGMEYVWPKYAQVAAYDFGGGMENVSATILGAGSLTDRREGPRNMASLNSHELGHQWFGDVVTCKSWGHAWLNESWATYAQIAYFRHARGEQAYLRELDGATDSYLAEARRYKRAIATDRYPNGDAMFDSHLYPKGGMVLHTLRKLIGDEPFWAGVKLYLTRHKHMPVETDQFRRAMTDGSGVQLQPFFEQWILKPGHPVLTVAPKRNEDGTVASVTVEQVQDTSDGTPIYDIPNAKLGVIRNGAFERLAFPLAGKSSTVEVGAGVTEVILDPDHDFLREIKPKYWTRTGLADIARLAPNGVDRTEAIRAMFAASPTDAEIDALVASLRTDRSAFPAVETLNGLADLKRPALEGFFLEELAGPSFDRRVAAATALAYLPRTPAIRAAFERAIRPEADVRVVATAVNALSTEADAAATEAIVRAAKIESRSGTIERTAFPVLAERDAAIAAPILAEAVSKGGAMRAINALNAMERLPAGSPAVTAALEKGILDPRDRVARSAVTVAAARGEKSLVGAMTKRAATAEAGLKKEIESALAKLR